MTNLSPVVLVPRNAAADEDFVDHVLKGTRNWHEIVSRRVVKGVLDLAVNAVPDTLTAAHERLMRALEFLSASYHLGDQHAFLMAAGDVLTEYTALDAEIAKLNAEKETR